MFPADRKDDAEWEALKRETRAREALREIINAPTEQKLVEFLYDHAHYVSSSDNWREGVDLDECACGQNFFDNEIGYPQHLAQVLLKHFDITSRS